MKQDSLLEQAKSYASQKFGTIQRLGGDTAFEHASRVLEILINNGIKDEITLVSAVLHPVIDETTPDLEAIKDVFGEDVTLVLENLAKLKKAKIDKDTPRAYNEAFFMQAYLKLSSDMRTLAVRLADRMDNLLTSFALEKDKRISAANKVLYLYAVVAKAVGLGTLSREMEDEAFKVLDPGMYQRIKKIRDRKEKMFSNLRQDISQFLEQIFAEHFIEAQVNHRVKHVYGIYRKYKHYISEGRKINANFDQIYDIIAMRIIVNDIETCYKVETLLNSTWDVIPGQRNDYIALPRPSGYRSLHNCFKLDSHLPIEIQVRTKEMHEYNEFGPASHLLYKIGDKGMTSLAVKKFKSYSADNKFWFKDLNIWNDDSATLDAEIRAPFKKFIYTFTPKGDIVELPQGAKILDFAYALHSDLGDYCMGAYVNKNFVGLNYELADGDYVVIKKTSKINVNADWLKLAKTSRAKSHIRRVLRNKR